MNRHMLNGLLWGLTLLFGVALFSFFANYNHRPDFYFKQITDCKDADGRIIIDSKCEQQVLLQEKLPNVILGNILVLAGMILIPVSLFCLLLQLDYPLLPEENKNNKKK